MMRSFILASAAALFVLLSASAAAASEADLVLPDLSDVKIHDFYGVSGRTLLMAGLVVSRTRRRVRPGDVLQAAQSCPCIKSMRDVSELIYETCKTYLFTQGKFILLLELFIGAVMVIYFGWLRGIDAPIASR